MLCDRNLKQSYRRFNKQYWNGELPEDIDVYWAPITNDAIARTTRDAHGYFTIEMAPSIAIYGNFTKLTLIHEMCHVALWDSNRERKLHGPTFKAELLRVLALGAIQYV